MNKTYDLNKAVDMVSLAKEVQASVYWGDAFYFGDEDESRPYKEFWDLVSDMVEEGYTKVTICNDDSVVFSK